MKSEFYECNKITYCRLVIDTKLYAKVSKIVRIILNVLMDHLYGINEFDMMMCLANKIFLLFHWIRHSYAVFTYCIQKLERLQL